MKFLRAALISLLISLLAGILIGSWIRLKLEAPVRYIGSSEVIDPTRARSTAARSPLYVG